MRERDVPVILEIRISLTRGEKSWQSACDRDKKGFRHWQNMMGWLPSWSIVVGQTKTWSFLRNWILSEFPRIDWGQNWAFRIC